MVYDVRLFNAISKHFKGRSIFPYGFLNSNNVKNQVGGWVRKKGLLELKSEKNPYTQKINFYVKNEEREMKNINSF